MKSVIAPTPTLTPALALALAPEPESEPEVLIVATVGELKWTSTVVLIDPGSTAMVGTIIVNQHSITDCLTMTLTSTATPTIFPKSPSSTAIET